MIKYLVLSGGGQTLFDYIGIFDILFEFNYININNINSIYGTSSGAIVGAFLCLKYNWKDVIDYIIRCPWENRLKISIQQAINLFKNNGVYDENLFISLYKSLLSGKNLSIDITLKEFYNYSNIELHIYTFELNEFITIDMSYKTHPDIKLLDAIRMSCSLPLIIKPICQDNKCYIDGGICANYPINECLENEKCDENEILGFKNFGKEIKLIDENSNIGDYINIIIRKCITIIKNKTIPNISNELHLHTDGISIELLIESLCDRDIRENLVNNGKNMAKYFLQYKNHTDIV